MKKLEKSRWSRRLARGVLLFAGALALGVCRPSAGFADTVDKATTDANITRIVTSVLGESQFAHHPLDQQLASKLLDRYVEALDGDRAIFLQSDVDGFTAYKATLSSASLAGDTRPAQAIFQRYLQRLQQQTAYDTELLASGSFDFAAAETFKFDRDHAARPRTLDEARQIWKQAVRAEFLQEKLGADTSSTAKPTDIRKTLSRRHEQRLRTMRALGGDEVLALYLDSLSHVYDPHSDYMGHEEMESFSIEMNLSLFGIGASLGNDEGTCTIHELVPGSPAEKSGLLKPGDRIIAVAQGDADPVDVSDMPLARIVSLIRGPKGTPVTLTILPPAGSAGAARTVKLVRAEIKLEDQQARARIFETPEPGRAPARLGVVELPSFYSGERGGKGAAADVAALLGKLKAEAVTGVVLDLRKNGGGSLDEAIKVAGLFIKSGPVVQTRDSKNSVQVGVDPDPGVVYDGPLVVLTSRLSASASEIVAGALQDYGRAVVVGDQTTFGKGTVQTIVPLGPMMDRARLGHAYEPGALKVTIAKFYRPSGASTELRGVASDIVIPSRTEVAPVGEAKLKDPLPWDTVASAPFERQNRVQPYLSALRAKSASRIGADRAFTELREENADVKQRLTTGQLSLNEAERRKALEATKGRDEEIERAARAVASARKSYVITLKDTSRPGLPAAEVLPPPKPAREAATGPGAAHPKLAGTAAPSDEIVLDESLVILRDYARSLTPAALPKTGSLTSRGSGAPLELVAPALQQN
jgi:carboxyl-terminal processing protease